MPFSVAELAEIAATTLKDYSRGNAFARNIKVKPLLDNLWNARKSTPGGQSVVSMPYKEFTGGNFGGIDSTTGALPFTDFNGDMRVEYPLFEHFAGLRIVRKQLTDNGIKVGTTNKRGAGRASRAEQVQLASILDSKLSDFAESWAVGMNNLVWGNGSADPLGMYGIRTYIVDAPATGTIGGLNAANVTSWRNIARIGVNIGTVLDEQNLIKEIEDVITDIRTNSAGRSVMLKGYIDKLTLSRLRAERRAKNQPAESVLTGSTDLGSSGNIVIDGVTLIHDPSMDAAGAGLSRRIYLVDHSSIFLTFKDGEDKLVHDPESPHNELAFYQGLLTTGNLVCDRRNTSAVISWVTA